MNDEFAAIETTGTINAQQQIQLDNPLPISVPKRVRLIVLYPLDDEVDELDWLHTAAQNPVFESLKESAEDIYTVSDGKPFHDKE
jgi:hypothetical protein